MVGHPRRVAEQNGGEQRRDVERAAWRAERREVERLRVVDGRRRTGRRAAGTTSW